MERTRGDVDLAEGGEIMDSGTRLNHQALRREAERELEMASQSRPFLIAIKGLPPGTMSAIGPQGLRIGRSPENDLSVLERNVSRNHARIEVGPDGNVEIMDLGSSNGTYVNGAALVQYRMHMLQDGDRVRFGPFIVFKFARLTVDEERSQRDLYERSIRDRLTGLYNRSFFLDNADGRMLRPEGHPGRAVALIDIDHFKRINDAHGHDGGDAILRGVANRLLQTIGPHDLLARYGGEEFALAMPRESLSRAESDVEAIRHALAETMFSTGSTSIRLTVSIGVAFEPPDFSGDASSTNAGAVSFLLTAADRFLYRAKHAGRNRVVAGLMPTTLDSSDPRTFHVHATLTDSDPPPSLD